MTDQTSVVASDLRTKFRALRRSGQTYEQIGEAHGFSGERVRQIIGPEPGIRAQVAAERAEKVAAVLAHLEKHGPQTKAALEEKFSLTRADWRHIGPQIPRHMLMVTSGTFNSVYTDREIMAAMKRVWSRAHKEGLGTGLSRAIYDDVRNPTDPSGARILVRYGSWVEACALAGVPHGVSGRSLDTYFTAWNEDDLLRGVRGFVDWCLDNGVPITYSRYDTWQRDHDYAASGSLVRNRLRMSWVEIVEAARALDAPAAKREKS